MRMLSRIPRGDVRRDLGLEIPGTSRFFGNSGDEFGSGNRTVGLRFDDLLKVGSDLH
jgi:hypothetical protein